MFDGYKKYLEFLDKKLNSFFECQKPYIFCKKGCAKCCKNAQFPYSNLEMQYLMQGFINLNNTTKNIVKKNISKLLKEKIGVKDFTYDCPFLVNDICSVYEYRGIICRKFGLLENSPDNRAKVPFCCYEGLNYSNIYDIETKTISSEKYKKNNFEVEPLGYNIQYSYLTGLEFEREFNIAFGEKRSLINWFEEYVLN